MSEHNYKKAIEAFTYMQNFIQRIPPYVPEDFLGKKPIAAILHALQLADKVTSEPSEQMLVQGYWTDMHKGAISTIFKAMIQQAIKETEDDG